MNFLDLVESRRSCRAFEKTMPEAERLSAILRAVSLAPSAGDLKAYAVKVIIDEDTKRNLAISAYEQDFVRQAPIVLVFFAVPEKSAFRYGERGIDLYCTQDATIACTYAQLAAEEMGLKSCWVGAFDGRMVKHFVPSEWSWRPVALLPIGYPLNK